MRASQSNGFGSSRFTVGTWPWSPDGHYGDIDEHEAIKTAHAALECGVTSFDTAPGYGAGYAEDLLGRALTGRRHGAVITTKFGLAAGRGRDSSRAAVLADLERSLRRLRTDYIDYYVGHWPDVNTPVEEVMQTLDDIVRSGKVRRVGLSNYTVELIDRARAVRPVDVVQVGYSLFDRRMEPELLPYCVDKGIPVMAYGPLAHGLLIDSISEDTVYGPRDWRTKGVAIGQPIFATKHFKQNVRVVHRLREEVARAKGVLVTQLALAWVLRHPAVSTALIGLRTPAELHQDIAQTTVLLEADLAAIDAIMADAAGRVNVFRPYGRAHEDWSE